MQIDAADRSTPSAIRKELARYGGMNPYNRAIWRLVIAEQRIVRRGGVFTEKGPQGGFRDVPKYPCKGWILERWFPASRFGVRADWENAKALDGVTPLMGPYPSEGDYFMLAGPFERMPEMGDLKSAISQHIQMEENRSQNYAALMKAEIDADTERDELALKRETEALAQFYQDEVEPIMKGTSLEAGRIRNEIAEKMGDFSHQGIA